MDEQWWFLCKWLYVMLSAWMRTGLLANDTVIHWLHSVGILSIRSIG